MRASRPEDPPMATRYDAIVIGTGQAGPSMAARLAAASRRTAVIERKRFGGTCVNNGCIPTKTLVASARAMHMARRGAEFGFSAGEVRADMGRIRARKEAIVRQSNQGVERWMKGTDGITVYEGHGRFEGPHTVRVGDEMLEAEQIFINVGARAFVPDMPGVEDVPYLTNSNVMDLDSVPAHLIIVGGSYIGLEFAQIYRRFGSRVTVVEKNDRLIGREDEDVSEALQDVLEDEQISFRLDASCIALRRTASGVAAGVDCTGGEPEVEGSHVLLAVGRRPNTDDLGLDRAGIATDARGFITVDDQCRTSVPSVWAIGECNGRGAFTHTSYNDYEIVAANLFDGDPRRVSDRIICYALYTDPPVGRCGMTTAEARATGRRVLVAQRPMEKVSRAREMSETNGFMRALVDAESRTFMGAVVFGYGGDEIIHSILDAMYAKAPYTAIARAVHIHPTITELIPTMLQDLKPLE
jgi:pyruvate/2-oxoglutarate dehydrogenase complex dihydrolipoamide dehydrogenase (E3) component